MYHIGGFKKTLALVQKDTVLEKKTDSHRVPLM